MTPLILLTLLTSAQAADLDDAVALAWKTHPDLGKAVLAAEPRTTRAPGILRFVDQTTLDPNAAPFLALRLREATDPPEVRRALAERLSRTDPSGGEWLVDTLILEPDAIVRAALVAGLVTSDEGFAAEGLALAAKDTDVRVREEAVLTRRMRGAE